MVEFLLKLDKIDVNKYSTTNGNTPLMIAIIKLNIRIAKILINYPKTNINSRNKVQETALTIAVEKKLPEVIDFLIKNERFDPDESHLNFAFYKSFGRIATQLSSLKSLDVNYKLSRHLKNNLTYENYMEHFKKDNLTKEKKETVAFYQPINKYGTALTNAVDDNNIDMIDLIINHSSFDKNKSLIDVAIAKAVYSNNVEIMRKLLELNNNDKNIKELENDIIKADIEQLKLKITELTSTINQNDLKCKYDSSFFLSLFVLFHD